MSTWSPWGNTALLIRPALQYTDYAFNYTDYAFKYTDYDKDATEPIVIE